MTEGDDSTKKTDAEIPFGRAAYLCIKWSLAAVPALVLLWLLAHLVISVLDALSGDSGMSASVVSHPVDFK